eukprot:477166-Amphidinium_carterae.1
MRHKFQNTYFHCVVGDLRSFISSVWRTLVATIVGPSTCNRISGVGVGFCVALWLWDHGYRASILQGAIKVEGDALRPSRYRRAALLVRAPFQKKEQSQPRGEFSPRLFKRSTNMLISLFGFLVFAMKSMMNKPPPHRRPPPKKT